MTIGNQQFSRFAHDLPWVPTRLTASGIILNRACIFRGFTIRTDGINNLEAEFFDDAALDANLKGGLRIVGSDLSGGLILSEGYVPINTLLRIVITGTIGAGYVLSYHQDYIGP